MVRAFTDTDLYKLSMQNAVCNLYPKVKARYTFINRDNREFPDNFGKRLQEIVDAFRGLHLSSDEYSFLKEKCYYLNPVYVDFLKGYEYNPKEVTIKQEGPKVFITIEGSWFRAILWEVPLMASISELYFDMMGKKGNAEKYNTVVNKNKALKLAGINVFYSEFGTRRRFSYENQNKVVGDFKKYGKGHMLGTSNVYLAMIHDLMSAGTVAHEWYQFHGARYGYKMANEVANEGWIKVYGGDLGTALTDTYTTDVFFKSFNTKYAKLFDGIRQDSGEPLVFIEKAVSHYNKLRVNAQFKTALFSDNLNSLRKIEDTHKACEGRIIDRYGIGTWLSNDVGVIPLNIVIKMTACDFGQGWVPTVKLSDDIKKNTGEEESVNLCKKILEL